MIAFLLWLLLLVICWPLALIAIVLYPIVWLLLLPFRLLGIVVSGVFASRTRTRRQSAAMSSIRTPAKR